MVAVTPEAVTRVKNPSSIKKPSPGDAAETSFCEPEMCIFVFAGIRALLMAQRLPKLYFE